MSVSDCQLCHFFLHSLKQVQAETRFMLLLSAARSPHPIEDELSFIFFFYFFIQNHEKELQGIEQLKKGGPTTKPKEKDNIQTEPNCRQ